MDDEFLGSIIEEDIRSDFMAIRKSIANTFSRLRMQYTYLSVGYSADIGRACGCSSVSQALQQSCPLGSEQPQSQTARSSRGSAGYDGS